MKPTAEQLEAVETAIRDVPFHERAQSAWDAIAPMVLEAADAELAQLHEELFQDGDQQGYRAVYRCAERIRALK